MKKGIKTWKLYYMVIIHILAVLGTTGSIIYFSIYFPGIWNWIFLLIVAYVNHIIFNNIFSYINRIINRKNRMF